MLLVLAVMFIAIAADFVIGCAPLQPGADPLVVRTEQTEQVARATFDSLVALDDSDRGFWRTNAPAFHGFCEWLREPITIEVSNTQPRGLAMILSLDDVKNAYESANASSNSLYTAWATFQATLDQANSWLTIVTNQPPTP